MHNKCECDKVQSPPEYASSSSPPSPIQPTPVHHSLYASNNRQPYVDDAPKMQPPSIVARPIIPNANTLQQSMLHHFATVVTASVELSDKDYGDIPLSNVDTADAPKQASCCSKAKAEKKDENTGNDCCGSQNTSSDIKHNNVLEPCCTNNRPCTSSKHKHSEKKSRIVLVTCRCGDDCACPGCDVHPSKVMKGKKDPYAGYTSSIIGEATVVHRKPSLDDIAGEDWKSPTAVFNEHGVMLCGCGCDRPFDSCRGCGNGLE